MISSVFPPRAGTSVIVAGVSASLICAAASLAFAQTRSTVTRPDQAPVQDLRTRPANGSGGQRVIVRDDESDDTEVEGDTDTVVVPDPRAARIGAGSARRRPPRIAPADAEVVDPDIDPDVGNGSQRLGNRRPADGDLAAIEPQGPRDGDVTPEQAPLQVDGNLALAEDMVADETSEDEGALADLDRPGRPITPRRFGAYQPVGVRIGSFILFPTVDAGIASTNNVFRSSTGRKSDMFAEFTPSALLSSNWSRHALELRVQAPLTFHDRFSSENDRRIDALARARIDISRRTNIAGELGYSYGQESRGGVNTPTSSLGQRPDVVSRRAAVEANHRFNRLTLQLRGAVTDTVYGTVPQGGGVTGAASLAPAGVVGAGNERNVVQRDLGGRAGWQFSPNLTLYADTVLNTRTHEAAGSADGILRNSEGSRTQVGIAVDARGKIQGEASAGWGSQTPDDPRLKSVSGFIYNGRLNWQPTGLTEVIFEARSDIGETTAAGSGGALTRSTGVEVRHALRRHIILVAGASYAIADFGGTNVRESSTVGRLGLEYYLSREMALLASYQHTSFESSSASGYQDDTVRVGLRVRR